MKAPLIYGLGPAEEPTRILTAEESAIILARARALVDAEVIAKRAARKSPAS